VCNTYLSRSHGISVVVIYTYPIARFYLDSRSKPLYLGLDRRTPNFIPSRHDMTLHGPLNLFMSEVWGTLGASNAGHNTILSALYRTTRP